MDNNSRVKYFRKKMKEKLEHWIPDNDSLVAKELKIFDKIMNRREFIQTTSAVAALALFYGCSSDKHDITQPPSAIDNTPLTDAELTSVKKASKIVIDSDVLDSYNKYNPLTPKGSNDNSKTKATAVMESFNPHIMTQENDQETTGYKSLDRNYGISEFVHLDKESDSTNYKLSIFEKDFYAQALKESSIELENTASVNFDKLIVANGNYHNRVENGAAYSQKMLLISNMDDKSNPDIRLYYQTASSPLLKAGVDLPKNSEWKYLDIINLFKTNEKDYSFKNYSIVDVDSYEDGSNNNFIYGTIKFDDLYNYGFVVTFSKIDATEPTISFFAPKFLSKESNVIGNLKTDFEKLDNDADVNLGNFNLEDFSLFSSQKFIPFAQIDSEVLFSFVSMDTLSDPDKGKVNSVDGSYDLSHFTDIYEKMMKRYLVSVDSSKGGVAYLLDSYTMNNASINVANNTFTLNFDTSDIETIDIWTLFKTNGVSNAMAMAQFEDSFVRYVKDENNELHIMLSSSILSESDIGIIHKSIKLSYSDANGVKENFTLKEFDESKSFMDASSFDTKEYKTMWFNDMKNSSAYSSLSECVHGDNGKYEFYSTHNHQGLLRSYFVIKVGDTNILLNFNEQGQNPEPTSDDIVYNSQNLDALYENIKSDNVAHFPPLPVNANVKGLLKWRSVGQDEEVVFSAMRPNSVNKETNTLQENSDNTLHSYFHANLDAIDGGWNTHEIEKNVLHEQDKNNIYKIPRHQVHIHVNNIYNSPAELEENVYIEVKFASSVKVIDHTNVTNPKTYHAKRDTSLFFKPNDSLISLEVSSGSGSNDIFNGATMLYRFADMSDFKLESNQPVATLISASQETTAFKQCNISFKQFERLTSQNADSYQVGMSPDELSNPQTPYAILHAYTKDSQKDNITKVTDLYQKIYENTQPQNDLAPAAADARELRSCCGFFKKWKHRAVSTIKQSASNVEKEVAKNVTEPLENLVDDVDTLANDVSQSIHTMLTSLMVNINKIVNLTEDFLIEIWQFVQGFTGMDTAWKIGSELHQLERNQLSRHSRVKGNAYSIIKDQTKALEKNIDEIATTFKENIDDVIDESLNTVLKINDTYFKSANDANYNKQKNSTKYNHLLDQVTRVFHKMNLDKPKDKDRVSDSAFVCDSSDTVEQLFKCLFSKEVEQMSSDIGTKLMDSEKVFRDFVYGGGVRATKDDMAILLKDSANNMADEVATIGKGMLQIPLAFLNGSSSITLAEEAFNGALKEVFEVLSFIFLQDKDKLKTMQDAGYFIVGYLIYISFSLYEEAFNVSNQNSFDVISYIKSGKFRAEVNGTRIRTLSSRSSNNEDSTAFKVMQVLDGIATVGISGSNWLSTDVTDMGTFFIFRKIVSPTFIVLRMITHSLVVKKHADADTSIYKATALYGDLAHYMNLVLQLFQQFTYKYEYIISGSGTGLYNIPTDMHIVTFIYESFLHLLSSSLIPKADLGDNANLKKIILIAKSYYSLEGSFCSGISDNVSERTLAEKTDSLGTIIVLNKIAILGSASCGITNFGLSLSSLALK